MNDFSQQPGLASARVRLRILDGSQTLVGGLGFLYGFDTVKDCLEEPLLKEYIEEFMHLEVAPALDVERPVATQLVNGILDHIGKYYRGYELINLTRQYSAKMKEGNVKNVLSFYRKFLEVPKYFSFGFAAYLLFMKCEKDEGEQHYGLRNGAYYPIYDPLAGYFCRLWAEADVNTHDSTKKFVERIVKDKNLWDDLSVVDRFSDLVATYLFEMLQKGVPEAMEDFIELGN